MNSIDKMRKGNSSGLRLAASLLLFAWVAAFPCARRQSSGEAGMPKKLKTVGD